LRTIAAGLRSTWSLAFPHRITREPDVQRPLAAALAHDERHLAFGRFRCGVVVTDQVAALAFVADDDSVPEHAHLRLSRTGEGRSGQDRTSCPELVFT
jgi:hypothetical protein